MSNSKKEYMKAWRAKNRQHVIEYRKRWHEANKEHHINLCREWRKKNPLAASINSKKWREKNPGYSKLPPKGSMSWLIRLEVNQRYRARKRAAFIEKVPIEQISNFESKICGICLKKINGEFDIDHIIPLSKGGKHERTNLQLAHPVCNNKKFNRLDFSLVQ